MPAYHQKSLRIAHIERKEADNLPAVYRSAACRSVDLSRHLNRLPLFEGFRKGYAQDVMRCRVALNNEPLPAAVYVMPQFLVNALRVSRK